MKLQNLRSLSITQADTQTLKCGSDSKCHGIRPSFQCRVNTIKNIANAFLKTYLFIYLFLFLFFFSKGCTWAGSDEACSIYVCCYRRDGSRLQDADCMSWEPFWQAVSDSGPQVMGPSEVFVLSTATAHNIFWFYTNERTTIIMHYTNTTVE